LCYSELDSRLVVVGVAVVVLASAIVHAVIAEQETVAAGRLHVATHAPSLALDRDPRCVAVLGDVIPAVVDAVGLQAVDVRETGVIPPREVTVVQPRERSAAADRLSTEDHPAVKVTTTDHVVQRHVTTVDLRGRPALATTTVAGRIAAVHHVVEALLQGISVAPHHSAAHHLALTAISSSLIAAGGKAG